MKIIATNITLMIISVFIGYLFSNKESILIKKTIV